MRRQGHGMGQLDRDHGEGGTREGAGAWEEEWELEGHDPGRGQLNRSI